MREMKKHIHCQALVGALDAGLDLGPGNPLWLGLKDRWANAFRWESSVTMHAWLALGLVATTSGRLLWRKLGRSAVLRGG